MLNLMHANPVVFRAKTQRGSFISCPDPKRIESFLPDTIAFSDSIKDGDQICYPCYKFFEQMLKSDVCMLASEDIVLRLKAKKRKSKKKVIEFEYLTPEPGDIVECCLYKTVLHACELVASDSPFLCPSTDLCST